MPPKTKPMQTNNDMIDFYTHTDIQKHLRNSHNPHFEDHQISLPARIGVIGNSGSRKSSLLLNFISKANDTFSHIYICAKTPDEPLYKFLQEKIKKDITFFSKLSELPPTKRLETPRWKYIVGDRRHVQREKSRSSQWIFHFRKKIGNHKRLHLAILFQNTQNHASSIFNHHVTQTVVCAWFKYGDGGLQSGSDQRRSEINIQGRDPEIRGFLKDRCQHSRQQQAL